LRDHVPGGHLGLQGVRAGLPHQQGRSRPAHRDPARLRLRRGCRQPALRHGRGDRRPDHRDPARPDRLLPPDRAQVRGGRAVKRSLFGRLWPNVTAAVLFIGFVFPVYWMFNTALKPTGDILSEDPVWFPADLTFEHFSTAINVDHFWTYVTNSLTVTVLAVVFSLVIALAGSFALARMRFKGRRGFIIGFMLRSEERRVGKGCGARWSAAPSASTGW